MKGPIATAVATAIKLDEIAADQGCECQFEERWATLVLGLKNGMFSTRHELHRNREERIRFPKRRTTA